MIAGAIFGRSDPLELTWRLQREKDRVSDQIRSKKDTALLDSVETLAELRALPESRLQKFADELRSDMISSVARTGGHLGAGLGVVELTVALHYVFSTPDDRLIWDVGHQAYLTRYLQAGASKCTRYAKKVAYRFTKRSEFEFDPFGAGHSSTSISAGYGMAVARDLYGEDNHVIAVIGDGSMSAGMAYEALNNAGASKSNLIVILNDNDMSIAPPVGAMSAYLSELISSNHSILFVAWLRMSPVAPSEIETAADVHVI